MGDQISFLITNHDLNFIPGEIGLEEGITILIATFGVFLEHRCWLLERLYPDGLPGAVEQFDDFAHDIGLYLILIAIVIEAHDILFLALNKWGLDFPGLKYTEITMLFASNLLALAIIVFFGWRLISPRVFQVLTEA